MINNHPFFVTGGNSRSKLVHFGTKPDKKKLADWKDSKDFNPIPIKAEFTPIVNLFSTANLDEKHNISSTAILQWFLPLYLKYCKVRKFLTGINGLRGLFERGGIHYDIHLH